jgi:hypothetical protein
VVLPWYRIFNLIRKLVAVKYHVHLSIVMDDLGEALIFVYNADSGLLNALNDGFLKIVSPSTYDCKLEFLHRDEFTERYDLPDTEFPSVYIKRGNDMNELISKEEFDKTDSLEELMELLKTKLEIND